MTAKKKQKRRRKLHIWDATCRWHVHRSPPGHPFLATERIDPGVNYFVLMLEQLGALPYFSCEGHPNGFYILFGAPMALAVKIKECGYFMVELEQENIWSLRVRMSMTESERVQLLKWAAERWEEKLGPLDWGAAIKTCNSPRKTTRKKNNAKLVQ